ncbi:tail fiber assembly protein [Pseudescherichia vulneris]
MSTIYFSAATSGFYFEADKPLYVAAGSWPTDAVEISERWYNHLIEGQANGRLITSNVYGQPLLTNAPEPTAAALLASAQAHKNDLMQMAADVIAPLQDAVDLDIETEAEAASLVLWKKYRVALNRVDLTNPDWPEVPR